MERTFFYHPSWPVLYLDNHLLGLYKPAGLLVQGDETGEVSLLELGKLWLKEHFQKPGLVYLGMVHRLDRPVGGVVLFARTSKAAGRLSSQFREGSVQKRYLAVVEGIPKERSGRLVHYIERGERVSSRILSRPTANAQEARLIYRVLDVSGDLSLIEVVLETGRKHQIRLQMAHIGHPVLGDLRYGASAPMPQKQIALFAIELNVAHPTKGVPVSIQSPLPVGWPWDSAKQSKESVPWTWGELSSVCT
jgi:23S rRNA pseudouridine1911/1915/1917 synthase